MLQSPFDDQIHLISEGTTTFGIGYKVFCHYDGDRVLVAIRPFLSSVQPWHIKALTRDLTTHWPRITLEEGDALQRLRNRFSPEEMYGFAAGEVFSMDCSVLGHVLFEIQQFHARPSAPSATTFRPQGRIAVV